MKHLIQITAFFLLLLPLNSCAQNDHSEKKSKAFDQMNNHRPDSILMKGQQQDTATFAAGCFWCIEEQFKQLNGVISITSGYTGGTIEFPSYEQVCTGKTGHAEACNIIFDPAQITYDELLAAFFVAHDPTQLNRQGNDIGTQYRSAIFYHNKTQKELANYYIEALNQEQAYSTVIVTQVSPYTIFYPAEDYHQNYYDNNSAQPYCRLVIKPKLDKFRKVFHDKVNSK